MRNPLQVRAELSADARIFGVSAVEFSQGRKGAIIGRLNEAFGSDENRRIALSWVFRGYPLESFSTKNLSKGEWFSLDKWIGSWHDDGGWHVRNDFLIEALMVVRCAIQEYVAMRMKVSQSGVVANGAVLPGLKIITEQESKNIEQ